jgi:hypothetical protein
MIDSTDRQRRNAENCPPKNYFFEKNRPRGGGRNDLVTPNKMSARDRIQVLLGHLKSPSVQLAQPMVTAGVSKAPGPQTKKYGGHLVAQTLKESGITHVFTLTGGHIAPILVGCNQVDISVIDVRDEAAAVFAADGTNISFADLSTFTYLSSLFQLLLD